MGRKRKNRKYFTKETEEAIIRYNKETNARKKNKIYVNNIHVPLKKIVEGIMNKYTFEYINLPEEDIQQNALMHLYDNLYHFDKDSGQAYSYFSVACKNYLIYENNKGYKDLKRSRELDVVDMERSVVNEISRSDTVEILSDFMNEYINFMQKNLYTIFRTNEEIKIADSLLEIFECRTLIEEYNKKALYLMIRERTGVDSSEISKVVNTLKEYYEIMYKNYLKSGDVVMSGSFW